MGCNYICEQKYSTAQFKLDRTRMWHGFDVTVTRFSFYTHVCVYKIDDFKMSVPYFEDAMQLMLITTFRKPTNCKTAAFHCLYSCYACSYSVANQVQACDMHLSCVVCVHWHVCICQIVWNSACTYIRVFGSFAFVKCANKRGSLHAFVKLEMSCTITFLMPTIAMYVYVCIYVHS